MELARQLLLAETLFFPCDSRGLAHVQCELVGLRFFLLGKEVNDLVKHGRLQDGLDRLYAKPYNEVRISVQPRLIERMFALLMLHRSRLIGKSLPPVDTVAAPLQPFSLRLPGPAVKRRRAERRKPGALDSGSKCSRLRSAGGDVDRRSND